MAEVSRLMLSRRSVQQQQSLQPCVWPVLGKRSLSPRLDFNGISCPLSSLFIEVPQKNGQGRGNNDLQLQFRTEIIRREKQVGSLGSSVNGNINPVTFYNRGWALMNG